MSAILRLLGVRNLISAALKAAIKETCNNLQRVAADSSNKIDDVAIQALIDILKILGWYV